MAVTSSTVSVGTPLSPSPPSLASPPGAARPFRLREPFLGNSGSPRACSSRAAGLSPDRARPPRLIRSTTMREEGQTAPAPGLAAEPLSPAHLPPTPPAASSGAAQSRRSDTARFAASDSVVGGMLTREEAAAAMQVRDAVRKPVPCNQTWSMTPDRAAVWKSVHQSFPPWQLFPARLHRATRRRVKQARPIPRLRREGTGAEMVAGFDGASSWQVKIEQALANIAVWEPPKGGRRIFLGERSRPSLGLCAVGAAESSGGGGARTARF